MSQQAKMVTAVFRVRLDAEQAFDFLRGLGYDDSDILNGGSDRLIDALVAHGDPATVVAKLNGHLEAGANHVPINLLTAGDADPMPGWTTLAGALFA